MVRAIGWSRSSIVIVDVLAENRRWNTVAPGVGKTRCVVAPVVVRGIRAGLRFFLTT